MPTPIFSCGGKCGVITTGATPGTGASKHWDTIDAGVSISATGGRDGGKCYEMTTGAGAVVRIVKTSLGSPATLVGRFYVKFVTSLPSADCIIATAAPAAGSFCTIKFFSADSTIQAVLGTGAGAGGGVAVVADTWYRIDFKADVSGATRTMDVRVNGTTVTQASGAVAASTISGFRIGFNAVTSAANGTDRITDLCLSATSGDYPLGAGAVAGLFPNADGTHNFNAAGDFKYNDSTNVPTSATDVNTYLDDALDNVTDFISCNAAANTEYVEVAFADLPAGVSSVNGVEVVMASHSAATQANKQTLRLNDGGTTSDVWADLDQSNTTLTHASKHVATAPTGGAWTKTKVDGVLARWNSSYGTVDEAPVPYVDAICLEVDYVPTVAASDNAEPGSYSLTGSAAMLLRGLVLVATAGTYAITGAPATTQHGYVDAANAGSYAITGAAISEARTYVENAVGGAYALTGAGATLLYGRVEVAAPGSYAVTGQPAGLAKGSQLNATAGAYVLTGAPATLLRGLVLQATAGAYGVTGQAATLLRGLLLSATGGSYAVTGAAATLIAGTGNPVENAAAGSYALTGAPATLLYGRVLGASAGAYVLTGASAGLLYGRVLQVSPGSYVVTGQAATLLWSGETIQGGFWIFTDRMHYPVDVIRSAPWDNDFLVRARYPGGIGPNPVLGDMVTLDSNQVTLDGWGPP